MGEIKKTKLNKRNENKIITILTLGFKNPKEDPRYGTSALNGEVFYWRVGYSNCRLEKSDPPNQWFSPNKQAQKARRKRQSSVVQTTQRGRGQKRKQRDANENEEQSYINEEKTVIEHQLTNND